MQERIKNLILRLNWSHVVVLIGCAGALFYFTLDRSELESKEQSQVSIQQELNTLERKVNEAREFERQFDDKKKKYTQLVKELQQLQSALPKQFYLPDLLTDLFKEAKQLEIEITTIQPDSKEEEKELYNSLGFSIEARGTFIQMLIFLDRMAHMKRLLNVENFSLNVDRQRPTQTLGGDQGAFASTNMSGGRSVYPGIKATLRVVTYRYRGTNMAESK